MSKNNLLSVHVFCRDCGQPMEVIQQEDADGDYFIQVTCWQSKCLLRGFTLSLDRYMNLDDSELEAYRQVHRMVWPEDSQFKAVEDFDNSELYTEAQHFFEAIEAIDPSVVKKAIRLNCSQRNIHIAHKLSEASRIMELICSLNREILKYNQAINKLRKEWFPSSTIASLNIQSHILLQTVLNLKQQYQFLAEEVEEMRQEKSKYLNKYIA